MFGGAGDVPDVHGLQAWIEKAWRAGFDVEVGECVYFLFAMAHRLWVPICVFFAVITIQGAFQLGGSLLGSDTWIGATGADISPA